MAPVNVIAFVMVLVGAVFLIISFPVAGKIRSHGAGALGGKWLVILYLIAFFVLGYLFFNLLLIFGISFPVVLVTGTVFLGGGVFVFIILDFTHKTIQERLAAEATLRDREACFQVIFDSMKDAILIRDMESGEILGANDTMCSMFGVSREELATISLGDLGIIPMDADGVTFVEQTRREGAQTLERMVRNKTGRRFWVEVSLHDAIIGGRKRLLLTFRDIDGRKHSQERLARLNDCFLTFSPDPQENIKRLTALCGEQMGATCALYNRLETGLLHTMAGWNAPPDLALVDNPEGHICHDVITQGNDRLFFVRDLQHSNYAESDPNVRRYDLMSYVGMPVRCRGNYVGSLCVVFQEEFTPDDEERKFIGILAAAIGVEEERMMAADELRRAHDGLERRVKERTAELAKANAQLVIDIADRKRMEEALFKSEAIFRNVIEVVPDMVAVIDRGLRIVHSNWQGGYEYVPEEVRKSSPRCYEAYYPGQGRPCDECHVLKVFESARPVMKEKYNPRVGLVEVRAFPIFDDGGKVVMAAEYIRNITEHRRLEEELRRAHKLDSLGVLAGGIAHDFNNLLTGILGNISLAKIMLSPADRSYGGLEKAQKAAERARDLTQQLLTFSKGGAPVKKTASIGQIVMDSATFVLRGSNVRCEFRIADTIWPVEVDEGQMSQVINNLIINADQSMPGGGIIRAAIENVMLDANDIPRAKAGRYVRISIEDQGSGISKENLQKIFDPYFTTKPKGSGLGLATVYSIVKSHDGCIRVESEIGYGTTFHIYLPASDNNLPEENRIRETHVSGYGRILIMDDDEIIREVASGILNHFGYETAVCSEGDEAVRLYSDAMAGGEPFSAVLMDLTIPGGMGGRETIKKLLDIDAGVVGIVSSGYCNDPILAEYRDYGFRGFVAKPYNMEELGKVLHDLLAAE